MRLFIGVALPDEIHIQLTHLCETLIPVIPSAKWVTESNFHVTLKFLGHTTPERVSEIVTAMRAAFADAAPFPMRLDRIGMFPSPRRARVVWLGISDGFTELVQLAEVLDLRLERLGYRTEERPHHPHITLARLRVPKPLVQLTEDVSLDVPPIDASVSVASATLFESKLSREGAQYFTVEEVPFGSV